MYESGELAAAESGSTARPSQRGAAFFFSLLRSRHMSEANENEVVYDEYGFD